MPTPGLYGLGQASVAWDAAVVHARTDPFALCADAVLVVLAVAYVAGLRRDPDRDGSAHAGTASFVLGLLSLYLALGSGFAGAQLADPSLDVGQHVLLMMVAPPLLVLGRPGRAAVAVHGRWRSPRSRSTPRRRAAVRALAPGARAASGVVSWPLYYGSMAAYFLTPAFAASLRDPVLLDATEVGFVAVGLLFWVGLVGTGMDGAPRSSAFRLAAVIAGMPVETVVGLALVLWPHPLATGETLAATHSAGLLLWLASMFTSGVALAVLLVQWCVADAKRPDLHDALGIGAIPTRSDAGAGRSRP